jgi:hypothetical protein
LIIRLIIHTIRQDPSGSVWTDEVSNVSRPDPTRSDQIDAEHQVTDLAVGVRSLAARRAPSSEPLKQEKLCEVDLPVAVLVVGAFGDHLPTMLHRTRTVGS